MGSSFQRIEYKCCVRCCGQDISSIQRPVDLEVSSSYLKKTQSGRWSWPDTNIQCHVRCHEVFEMPVGALDVTHIAANDCGGQRRIC